MLYHTPPENFAPIVEVVCCWITHKDEVLFLKRAAHCSQGGRENLPGGKVDPGETLEQAVLREIYEECGFKLDNLSFAQTFYIRRDEIDFTLHAFKSQVVVKPDVRLDLRENTEYKWLTMAQIGELDQQGALITDGMACVQALYES